MDSFSFDLRDFTPADAKPLVYPYGGTGGGGSANVFPIILAGPNSLIGYVLGSSSVAINLFKMMVKSGETSFSYDEQVKDSDFMSSVRLMMTTDDFAQDGPFHIGQDTGYTDLPGFLYSLRDSYEEVLESYNGDHPDSRVSGVVANCVTGLYGVRPVWGRRSASSENEESTQYSLTRLDFGTEAQLATWDGDKYLCDYDSEGNQRDTPVVKRVYVGSCPNSPEDDEDE